MLGQEVAVFLFSAGFTGQMNQETGMIVSLPMVDQAMKQLIAEAEEMQFSDEFHFLNYAFLALGKTLNIFEVKLQTETQLFSNKMGILQSLERSNLQVQFLNESKLYWVYSEKPLKKKMKVANLAELLDVLGKEKGIFSLVDPLTEIKYLF